MPVIEVILGGVILGGLYALVAMGFNLQYGVARIVNLAYGEFLMSAAFAAFWIFPLGEINPILGMALTVPATFGANWLIYRALMTPLARRARTRDQLEGETILATFGLLFVLRGAATLAFTANNRYDDYLGEPLPRGITGPLIDTWAWLSRPVVLARHSRRHRGHLGQNRAARERETLTRWPRCCRPRV